MAILAGLGVSISVAIALTAIGILFGAEYEILLIIGAVLVSAVIYKFVPNNKSIFRAVIVAILYPTTYFLYQVFIGMFGYYTENVDGVFWPILVGSSIFGAFIGYIGDND